MAGWFDSFSPELLQQPAGRTMGDVSVTPNLTNLNAGGFTGTQPGITPNPAGTTVSGAQMAGQSPQQDPQAFIQQWQQSHPVGMDSYLGLIDAMKQAGYNVERPTHAGGTLNSNDKIAVNGQVFDLIGDEGGANQRWTLGQDGYWINGKPASDPYGSPPQEGGTMGGMYGGFGGLMAPWTQEFKRRSPEEIAQDPGFQFQMEQGSQAIERGAAARGNLLSGGTLKALTRYGQGLAHTYDQDFYNRDRGEYLLGRENFYNNQDRPFDKLSSLVNIGTGAANRNNSSGSSYASNMANAIYGQGNANAAGSAASGSNWGQLLSNAGQDWYDYFNKR